MQDASQTINPRASAHKLEGAAIAQTCYLNNVPFVIIRAISDKPDETKFEDYRVFEPKAAKLCASIVERMIEGV